MTLSDEEKDMIVSTCRTAIGDELRSITYLSSDDVEHLYTRTDLDTGEDSLRFFESERKGFESERRYGLSDLGDFRYAIRAFENGYLGRVIVGDRGVYVTTDALTISKFDEVATSVKRELQEM